ncbi:MAG: hypothetical protein WC525_09650 [Candidatus Thermoplasmatota archaeon]
MKAKVIRRQQRLRGLIVLCLLGLFTVLISVGLSGCTEVGNTSQTERNKFVGTWYKSNYLVMQLNADGICTYLAQSGTWEVTDGKLHLELSSGYAPIFTYAFSDSDLTIKLTSTLDGSTAVYTKRGEP